MTCVDKIFLVIFILICALPAINSANAISVNSTIKVGMFPEGLAYDYGKSEIFVANWLSDSVSVISDNNNSIITNITVGSNPDGITYDSHKGEIFVTNYASGQVSGTVSVISDSNNTVIATIPVGAFPCSIAYDSDKSELFVANYGSGTISIISDETNTIVSSITVGSKPTCVAYDSGKGEIFVANYASVFNYTSSRGLPGFISVISDSNNAVIANFTVGDYSTSPYYLTYDDNTREIFVTTSNAYSPEGGSHTVFVISDSSNTMVANITVGFNPNGISYGSGELFVANYADSTLSVVSDRSNNVVANITVGSNPINTIYDSGKDKIFVTNSGENTISVISNPSITSVSPSPIVPELSIPVLALLAFTVVIVTFGITVLALKSRHESRFLSRHVAS